MLGKTDIAACIIRIRKLLRCATGWHLITIAGLILFTLSCEDVIDIDLDNVEPRLVIEATVTEWEDPVRVAISKTGDYFNPSVFPPVTGAVVRLSDNQGSSVSLTEIAPGQYESDSLRGRPGLIYTMVAEVEGTTYTATSFMPRPIYVDRLSYQYEGEETDDDDKTYDNYSISIYFRDWPGDDDYCRIAIDQNGHTLDDYYLYDGQWSDGNDISFSVDEFRAGDTVDVRIIAMDEDVFDYFWTLQAVVATEGGGQSGWAPANPNTNWNPEALGYFGALTVRSMRIIINP